MLMRFFCGFVAIYTRIRFIHDACYTWERAKLSTRYIIMVIHYRQ
jgi:hypothetical protein